MTIPEAQESRPQSVFETLDEVHSVFGKFQIIGLDQPTAFGKNIEHPQFMALICLAEDSVFERDMIEVQDDLWEKYGKKYTGFLKDQDRFEGFKKSIIAKSKKRPILFDEGSETFKKELFTDGCWGAIYFKIGILDVEFPDGSTHYFLKPILMGADFDKEGIPWYALTEEWEKRKEEILVAR